MVTVTEEDINSQRVQDYKFDLQCPQDDELKVHIPSVVIAVAIMSNNE